MNWQNHIHSDPSILLGKPVIKGTRISIELILELYELGWTNAQIQESYTSVSADDIRAVFSYLRDCVKQELYFPLAQAG